MGEIWVIWYTVDPEDAGLVAHKTERNPDPVPQLLEMVEGKGCAILLTNQKEFLDAAWNCIMEQLGAPPM